MNNYFEAETIQVVPRIRSVPFSLGESALVEVMFAHARLVSGARPLLDGLR